VKLLDGLLVADAVELGLKLSVVDKLGLNDIVEVGVIVKREGEPVLHVVLGDNVEVMVVLWVGPVKLPVTVRLSDGVCVQVMVTSGVPVTDGDSVYDAVKLGGVGLGLRV